MFKKQIHMLLHSVQHLVFNFFFKFGIMNYTKAAKNMTLSPTLPVTHHTGLGNVNILDWHLI